MQYFATTNDGSLDVFNFPICQTHIGTIRHIQIKVQCYAIKNRTTHNIQVIYNIQYVSSSPDCRVTEFITAPMAATRTQHNNSSDL